MATKTLKVVDTYIAPRVNLLPPEIGLKKAERKSYTFMGAAVAGAGVAAVALYLGQASKVSSAKDELQKAKSDNARLKTQRAQLQDVQDVYAQVDADEALMTLALERRVLWSVYLHNLSIGIPENVWVTQLSASVAPPASGQPVTAAKPVGAVTFAGSAFSYNDVAAWLESVAKMKGVTNAAFSTAVEEKPRTASGRTIVKFSSSVALTSDAITPHKKPGSR